MENGSKKWIKLKNMSLSLPLLFLVPIWVSKVFAGPFITAGLNQQRRAESSDKLYCIRVYVILNWYLRGYPWENHAKGATVHITELAQTFHIGITWWSIGRYGISFVQASFFSFFQGGYAWTAKSTLKYVQILWFFEWQYFWQIVQQSRWNKILTNY